VFGVSLAAQAATRAVSSATTTTVTTATTTAATTPATNLAAPAATASTVATAAPRAVDDATAALVNQQQHVSTIILNAMHEELSSGEQLRAVAGFAAAYAAMQRQSQLTLALAQQICQLFIAPSISQKTLQSGLQNVAQAWHATAAPATVQPIVHAAQQQQSDAQPLAYLADAAAAMLTLPQRASSDGSRLAALKRLLLTEDDDNDSEEHATSDINTGKLLSVTATCGSLHVNHTQLKLRT
jgi:replication fork clamp-binding protein CrfC